MKNSCDQLRNAAAYFMASLYCNLYSSSRKQTLQEKFDKEFFNSQSFIHRKGYIQLCAHLVKLISFKNFRELFLSNYMKAIEDPVAEVRVSFLNSVSTVRPYLENDIDLILQFNNSLNAIRTNETSKVVSVAIEKMEQQLKQKGMNTITEKEEKGSKLLS